MCHEKGCCKNYCLPVMVGKILLLIGGINWGLVGVGMFLNSDFNVIKMLLGSWPIAEAVVYVLVGVAAVVKIFGCRCKKCMERCVSCAVDEKVEEKM